MFSNPLFNANTDPNSNDNANNLSTFSDQKDMIGDITDQSLDVSNIEDNNPIQKGFSNPFHEKLEKPEVNEKINIPKEEARAPALQNVREESQPRPSVKDLIKNFQPKKVEQPEEKPQQPTLEGRGSVKNLISRFEKKPAAQEEPSSPSNVISIESRGSVTSMIRNIERKVSENENKIINSEVRQLDMQKEKESNREYQSEATPIQETNEKHEQSGLGLEDYSQDMSNFEEGNTSQKAAGGFSNPYKDVMLSAQKKSLLDQSQELLQDKPRQTAQFGESVPEQNQGIQFGQNEYLHQGDTSKIDKTMTEEGLLDDMTVDDESLNVSGYKPMMNNPLGLNRSYMDPNRSQLDVSRSKLNYSNISQMGNKPQAGSEYQAEGADRMHFNFDANIDYAQGNMELRVNQFDEHMLSQMTDDTQDLSHMTIPGFKNVFYGKDNSYYLNMTALDQSNISAVNRSYLQAKVGEKSVNKSHNKTGILSDNKILSNPEGTKQENILDELHAPSHPQEVNITPAHFEPRPTANFGIEPLGQTGEREQKQDLLRPEETDENVPRPTGHFGMKSPVVEETNTMIERVQKDLEQNKSQGPKVHNEWEDKEHEENKNFNTSQIIDQRDIEKDPFKLSQLDISKISVFDTTQDNDEFNPNVTVNNMRAFLSTSHSRLGFFDPEKKDHRPEYDGDLTLEFHQEINPDYKKHSLALNQDQPKISEVSLAKEETQIMEESKALMRAQSADEKSSPTGHKDVSSEKEPAPTSKSFNDKVANSFVAPGEVKNKSFDEAKPAYNNYTNPFTTSNPQEIYENRLTVGNLPPTHPVLIEKQSTHTNPFTGLNKSYDTILTNQVTQDTPVYLNKSYQNVPSNVQFDNANKFTGDIQTPSISVQKNPEEAKLQGNEDPNAELVKEGIEIVNRMKNVYNDWKVKNEQFDGYLEEIKRFTFQTPIEQIKIDRSFDTTLKSSKENDRMTHSFDVKELKAPQVLQHQDMSHPSSYYKQDLLSDEKSFSELNVSQEPASQFKKFSNPNFMKSSEEALAQKPEDALKIQEESGSYGQRDPHVDSAKAINRIFEGFTLGGSRKPVGEEQQSANMLHQSFDIYRTDQVNAKENLNKSYSEFTIKGQMPRPVDISNQVGVDNLGTLNKMEITGESSENKTSYETPNFAEAKVSMSSLEPNKDILEGASVEGTQYFREAGKNISVSINESLELSKMKTGMEPSVPLKINIPLKLKQQKRQKPQILDPQATVALPAEVVVDFVVAKKEEKKSINPIPNYFEQNSQRRFFGFKVKKESFVRDRNQRKINAEIEIICKLCDQSIPSPQFESHLLLCNQTSILKDETEESVVPETVDDLNRKLENIKSKLRTSLSLSYNSFLGSKIDELTLITDNVIAEDKNLATIQQTIEHVSQLLKEGINGTQINPGFFALIGRILILSKAKYSKLDLSISDKLEISKLRQQNFNYEKETLAQKSIIDLIGYQVEVLHEIKLEGDRTPRYIKSSYKAASEVLADIDSDINCSDDEGGQSTVSSIKSIRPLQVGRSGHRSTSEGGKKDNSKIKFYSIAVNYRLDLPPEHPGKNVAIADLYNECMEQNIPEKEWNDYLKKKILV